jgi:hypothetical protein
MRGIIRKILLEHNGVDVVNLSPKELKLFSYLIESTNDFDKNVLMYRTYMVIHFRKMLNILTPDLIEKYFFLLLFNTPSDIVGAHHKKDISNLYFGPFYLSTVTHYGDWDSNTEWVYEPCDYCDLGETTETCGECSGIGYIKDEEDGETWEYECNTCGGSGEETDTCDYCGGSGEQSYESNVYTLDEIEETFITKNGISEDVIESTWSETYKKIFKDREKYFPTYVSDAINSFNVERQSLNEKEELKEDQITEFDSIVEEVKPNIGFRNFLFKQILMIDG